MLKRLKVNKNKYVIDRSQPPKQAKGNLALVQEKQPMGEVGSNQSRLACRNDMQEIGFINPIEREKGEIDDRGTDGQTNGLVKA